jgi:hypothetical protein
LNPTNIVNRKKSSADNPISLSAKHAAFVAQLALSGDSAAAARAVGYTEGSARNLLMRRPDLRDAAEEARKNVTAGMQKWADLVDVAQRKIIDLLRSTDDRVALRAAQEILNRAEGRPRQSVEVRVEEPEADGPSTGEMRLALSLVMARRVSSMGEALEFIERNPEAAQAWIAKTEVGSEEGVRSG